MYTHILSSYILIWCLKCVTGWNHRTKALWDVRLCQDAFGVLPGLDVSLLENSEAVGFEVSWSTKFGLPGKTSHLISPKSYIKQQLLSSEWSMIYIYICIVCLYIVKYFCDPHRVTGHWLANLADPPGSLHGFTGHGASTLKSTRWMIEGEMTSLQNWSYMGVS